MPGEDQPSSLKDRVKSFLAAEKARIPQVVPEPRHVNKLEDATQAYDYTIPEGMDHEDVLDVLREVKRAIPAGTPYDKQVEMIDAALNKFHQSS